MKNWQTIPILKSDEPLIVVDDPKRKVFSKSVYRQQGFEASLSEVWLRLDLAKRLVQAASLLPEGIGLLALDGWRSDELQRELFELFQDNIAASQGLSGNELLEETLRFVSMPRGDCDHPAPHLTGGTIDLVLCDLSGAPLDMGGEFDELTDRSMTCFYENGSEEFRDRRRLLCSVMAHVGFSNYDQEWWHFDCGNQWHHARVGGPARYGAVMSLPRKRYTLAQIEL